MPTHVQPCWSTDVLAEWKINQENWGRRRHDRFSTGVRASVHNLRENHEPLVCSASRDHEGHDLRFLLVQRNLPCLQDRSGWFNGYNAWYSQRYVWRPGPVSGSLIGGILCRQHGIAQVPFRFFVCVSSVSFFYHFLSRFLLLLP